jgi:DNA-binding MarR family transcriptional regulator
MPRNGPYVLGGMANHGGAAAEKIRALGVSRQAASQLVDTLVERNYLRRDTDHADRRRVALELTDRGQAAATAVRAGVVEVDENLARRCPPAVLAALRAGLVHSSTSERNARTPCADAD